MFHHDASLSGVSSPLPDLGTGTPADVTAQPGNAQVSLSWTAPSAGAGPASGYNVYAGTAPGHESSNSVNGTSPLTGTAYTVSGLSNGTTYYFEVTAVNSAGEGALSSCRLLRRRPSQYPRPPPPEAGCRRDAECAARSASPDYGYYRGVKARHHGKVAARSVARKLILRCHHILRSFEPRGRLRHAHLSPASQAQRCLGALLSTSGSCGPLLPVEWPPPAVLGGLKTRPRPHFRLRRHPISIVVAGEYAA